MSNIYNGSLTFSSFKKLISELLSYKRISYEIKEIKEDPYREEDLSRKLGLTITEFERIKNINGYRFFAKKITLPLASIYCSTKLDK